MSILGILVPVELLYIYGSLIVLAVIGVASCFTRFGSGKSIGLIAVSIVLLLATLAGHIFWALTEDPWKGVGAAIFVAEILLVGTFES